MHALNLSYFLKPIPSLWILIVSDPNIMTQRFSRWSLLVDRLWALWLQPCGLWMAISFAKKNHIQQTKNHHRGPIREDLKLCRTISLILQTVIIFLITKMRLNNTYYNVFVFWKELPLSPVRDVSPTFSVQLCRFLQIFRNADRLSLIWIYVSVQKDETYKQIIITQNKFINRGSLSQH